MSLNQKSFTHTVNYLKRRMANNYKNVNDLILFKCVQNVS